MTTDKNFAAILKTDENGHKIIDRVGQTSSPWFMEECEAAGPGNYILSDFMEYVIGERIDYYVNGKRMTDYEIWLKYGVMVDGNFTMKYNDQGQKVQKSRKELLLEGHEAVPTGFEIVNGEIVPVKYYWLKKTYLESEPKDRYETVIQYYQRHLDNISNLITVNLNGNIYTLTNDATNTLNKLINLNIPVIWRDDNNEEHPLSKEDATALLKAIETKKQEMIRKVWDARAKVKALINDPSELNPVEKIIPIMEGLCHKNLDDINFVELEQLHLVTDKNTIQTYSVPDESPYSGLVDKAEIKKLRTKKGAKSKKLDNAISSTDDLGLQPNDNAERQAQGLPPVDVTQQKS